MRPYEAARQGIARTFQNIALFKGMSTLDNIMTGRNLKMKTNLFLFTMLCILNLSAFNVKSQAAEEPIEKSLNDTLWKRRSN